MLLSIVTNTSNCFSACARSAPFFKPAHPTNGTDSTWWPGKSRRNRQSRFSSSRIFTSCSLKDLLARDFENGDHLLPSHAGKPLEEILDGIAGFEVVEETSDGDAGADKNQGSSENFGIRVYDGLQFHRNRLMACA